MEHVRPKLDSDTSDFFQAIAGAAVATLVMCGVGGTVYRLVARDGWLGQVFDRSLPGGLAVILTLMIMGLCVKQMQGLMPARILNRYSETFVYGFAAVGAIYAAQYLGRGAI